MNRFYTSPSPLHNIINVQEHACVPIISISRVPQVRDARVLPQFYESSPSYVPHEHSRTRVARSTPVRRPFRTRPRAITDASCHVIAKPSVTVTAGAATRKSFVPRGQVPMLSSVGEVGVKWEWVVVGDARRDLSSETRHIRCQVDRRCAIYSQLPLTPLGFRLFSCRGRRGWVVGPRRDTRAPKVQVNGQ
jgi:hypothetical protein